MSEITTLLKQFAMDETQLTFNEFLEIASCSDLSANEEGNTLRIWIHEGKYEISNLELHLSPVRKILIERSLLHENDILHPPPDELRYALRVGPPEGVFHVYRADEKTGDIELRLKVSDEHLFRSLRSIRLTRKGFHDLLRILYTHRFGIAG